MGEPEPPLVLHFSPPFPLIPEIVLNISTILLISAYPSQTQSFHIAYTVVIQSLV